MFEIRSKFSILLQKLAQNAAWTRQNAAFLARFLPKYAKLGDDLESPTHPPRNARG